MNKILRKFNNDVCEVNQLDTQLEQYREKIREIEGDKDKRIKKINQGLFLISKNDLLELKEKIKVSHERSESEKYCEFLDRIENKENLNFDEVNELKFCVEKQLKEEDEKKSFFQKILEVF